MSGDIHRVGENSDLSSKASDGLPPLAPGKERHFLQKREELRFEVTFGPSSANTTKAPGTTTFCLQKGSCELYGCELALGKTYTIAHGGIKGAFFTWHGCVIDLGAEDDDTTKSVEFFSYTSDETDANVAFVNTHAQLEALRDDASASGDQGPRVMIVGPPECGKTTLAKTLIAYACKVGRTPLMVDLDPKDNSLSVPGSLVVAPMHQSAVTVETYATTGLPVTTQTSSNGTVSIHPLVVYHGSTEKLKPDLFKAQVEGMANCIEQRLQADDLSRASGIVINTNGWIRDEGYECLLHSAKVLKVDVLLVLGHDRLYSMLKSHFQKAAKVPKLLKLPRSGGVVSRPTRYLSGCRSRAVKRYFYGDLVVNTTENRLVHQLTPFANQIPFGGDTRIYKVSSMALANSLLPVNASHQSTESIQLVQIDLVGDQDAAKALQHSLLAVCHPSAVEEYEASGMAKDLVAKGVAGFCVVDKVLVDTDTLHLLSPCAGGLPSKTFVVGDITWME